MKELEELKELVEKYFRGRLIGALACGFLICVYDFFKKNLIDNQQHKTDYYHQCPYISEKQIITKNKKIILYHIF